MKVSFVLTGVEALDKRLLAAPLKLQRAIERKACRAAAKPVLESAKQFVLKDEQQLVKTLKIRAMPRSRRNRGIVGVRVTTDKKILEQIHQEDPGIFNPHWSEFGAPGHMLWGKSIYPLPPHLWMTRAMDANRGTVGGIFVNTVRTIVETEL